MTNDLDAILGYLRGMNRPVAGLLQPGISVPELRIKTATFPTRLPEEVILLYGWHNGTRSSQGDMLDDLHFFPGFYFLPIEEAVEHWWNLRDAPGWNLDWLPLFANGGGDFYAAMCGEVKTDGTPIVGYIMGENKQDVEYESLASMFRTIRACFERGAFFLSQSGYLEANDVLHARIAKELGLFRERKTGGASGDITLLGE